MFLIDSFLEVVGLSIERTGDAAFVLGVLEVDDVMRFDLLHAVVLLMGAVLDELPKTLTLVLVYDGDPPFLRLLDARPVLDVFPSFLPLRQRAELVVLVEVDALIVLCEVHEAVGVDVVDEEFVIEVDIVTVVLVGPVRVDLPYDLRVRLRTHLDREGTVACISCLVQSS